MGNYVNKYFSNNTEMHSNDSEEQEIKNSFRKDTVTQKEDAMQTPVIHKTFSVDPRSVTSGIDRTPIEMDSTPIGLSKRMISAIPKHLRSGPYLETDIDKAFLCLTPKKRGVPKIVTSENLSTPDMILKNSDIVVTPIANNLNNQKMLSVIEKERYKILGLDPRSPAADFNRTPILTPRSLQRLRARSQEHIHRRGSYDTDIFYSKMSYCEVSSQFNLTEIQALPDLAASTLRSLDLVNVNSDSQRNDSCSSHSSGSENYFENYNEITVIEDSVENSPDNVVCKNGIKPNKGVLALPGMEYSSDEILKNLKQDHSNSIKQSTKFEEICICANDTVEIWKDSLIDESRGVEKIESEDAQVTEEKQILQPCKSEVIVTCDDNNVAEDALSLKFSKCEGNKARRGTIGKKKNATKSHDENKVFNANDKNGNVNMQNRTPLGNRSNNGQKQMLVNSPQQMFRNKGITPKMLQENTPPHKKYVTKSKLSGIQWDPDSTVII